MERGHDGGVNGRETVEPQGLGAAIKIRGLVVRYLLRRQGFIIRTRETPCLHLGYRLSRRKNLLSERGIGLRGINR